MIHRAAGSICEACGLSDTYLCDTPSTISITKATYGGFILPTSKMSSTTMDTLPPSYLRKNVVVEEQLYTEQYWQNNRDNIRQLTFDI